VLRFLQSSLLVTGTGCQVKIDFETNGILAQKNSCVGAVEEKNFCSFQFCIAIFGRCQVSRK
jgi:hypothetical protein